MTTFGWLLQPSDNTVAQRNVLTTAQTNRERGAEYQQLVVIWEKTVISSALQPGFRHGAV